MSWHFDKAQCEAALATMPPKLGPQPGEWFHALPLEDLSDERQTRERQHIHTCAMLCLDCDEEAAQGRIMDYIIANERAVPIFMLNDVPMYLAGYKRAKADD